MALFTLNSTSRLLRCHVRVRRADALIPSKMVSQFFTVPVTPIITFWVRGVSVWAFGLSYAVYNLPTDIAVKLAVATTIGTAVVALQRQVRLLRETPSSTPSTTNENSLSALIACRPLHPLRYVSSSRARSTSSKIQSRSRPRSRRSPRSAAVWEETFAKDRQC